MKYLIPILLLFSCKKTNVITYQLSRGAGDVIITFGGIVSDFNGCSEGWTVSMDAKPKTRYTIWTNAKNLHEVRILYNGKTVAKDSVFTAFETK